MDFDFVRQVLEIILIDLVLSGDNAVVIGMAARRLPAEQQRRAILFGGLAAVVLRIIFTIAAALLLGIPLLRFTGGLLLIWIAVRLLRSGGGEEHVREGNNLLDAIRVIVIADVVMSLDNMLAVGAASHGNLGLLIFGLVLSIPILLFGSSVVAGLINRYPWLLWVGAAVLARVAGQMIVEDPIIHPFFEWLPYAGLVFPIIVVVLTLGYVWLTHRRGTRAGDREESLEGTGAGA